MDTVQLQANTERLLGAAAQLLDTLNVIAGQLAAALEAREFSGDTAEAPAPKKRGPKPKGENAAPSVASGGSPAAAPSNTAPPGIGSPASPPPPLSQGQSAASAPAAQDDDPLGPMPDFLDRNTQSQPATAAPPPAPPPQLSEQQVKDTLRVYMQRFGEQGTAKLTNLLQTVAGVKRFSECPIEKWPAVLQAANAEMK
jgi:hypothetical protein